MMEPISCQRSELDHQQLLVNVKKSVELSFLIRGDSSERRFSSSEALLQIEAAVKSILLDGLIVEINAFHFRKLVNDLNWLNRPVLLNQPAESYAGSAPIKTDDLSTWITYSLKNGDLCLSLQHLVEDKELLESYYSTEAFLWNDKYATALFICLSAFELNQSNLISQIDTSLYAENLGKSKHKRSSSHPHFSISPTKNTLCKKEMTSPITPEVECVKINKNISFSQTDGNQTKPAIFRRFKSLPNIRQIQAAPTRQRSKTVSQPIGIPRKIYHSSASLQTHETSPFGPFCSISPGSDYNNGASSSRTSDYSDLIPIQLVKCDDIKIHEDQTQIPTERSNENYLSDGIIDYETPPHSRGASTMNLLSCLPSNVFFPSYENLSNKDYNLLQSFSTSAPSDFVSAFLPQNGEKLKSRFTNGLFDDIVDQIFDSNESSPTTPIGSQSIASFLQSAALSRNNTDLERENAHFKISEAIISVIEQIKSSKAEQATLSKRNSISKKATAPTENIEAIPSSTSRAIPGNRQESNVNINNESPSSEEGLSSNLFKDKIESSNKSNSNDYVAYAEWGENELDALSAEGVALSLISKFRDKQLPRASDITWLVSEEDAPQSLLPMPERSSDPDENVIHSFTRGTRDWAPPRQQVIFTDHPPPIRKTQMQSQNFRCAGCGMKVAAMYINRYRYCTYLGKYHCSGCHRNQISIIPAKVLEKWDFTYFPVSVFAYRLLEQIWTYPLFYVPDLNPSLYTKIKSLAMAKLRRTQLKYIHDFIKSCRFSEKEKKFFDSIPSYWYLDSDKWAMSDFIAAKNGCLHKTVLGLIETCEEHVFKCVLCTAHGFICELCQKEQIIYPWQVKVKRCGGCGTCFHMNCWRKVSDCVKCQRLKIREQRIL